MFVYTYLGVGKAGLVEKPMPEILKAGDAVVRLVKTTICGTDLHIIKGDVPAVTEGRILGHEGVGIVEGPAVLLYSRQVGSGGIPVHRQ